MDRPTYHQSQIKDFLMCGLKWTFKNVDKIKMPMRAAASIGSSVDAGVSANMAQKISSRLDMPLDAMLAACSDDFDKRMTQTIFDEEDTQGAAKDSVMRVAEFHHRHVAPLITPASSQEQFVIETDAGYNLAGAIDCVDTSDTIIDTKTSSRQRASSHVVERAFQPAMYDFAFQALRGRAAKNFRFDVITRPTKTLGPEYKPVTGVVTEGDHHWLFNSITQVDKAIRAGVALPAPEGSWQCSEKWCEYWAICKGKK